MHSAQPVETVTCSNNTSASTTAQVNESLEVEPFTVELDDHISNCSTDDDESKDEYYCSSEDDESKDVQDMDIFKDDLRHRVHNYVIPQNAVSSLLGIMRKNGVCGFLWIVEHLSEHPISVTLVLFLLEHIAT